MDVGVERYRFGVRRGPAHVPHPSAGCRWPNGCGDLHLEGRTMIDKQETIGAHKLHDSDTGSP
ncbi:MAG: hypothetical protein AB7R77_13635, partial [Ilumatobacteraceae bacterium]